MVYCRLKSTFRFLHFQHTVMIGRKSTVASDWFEVPHIGLWLAVVPILAYVQVSEHKFSIFLSNVIPAHHYISYYADS